MFRRDRGEERGVREARVVQTRPWSPAQIVAIVIGIGFLILGAVSIADVGFDSREEFLHRHGMVAGFHHTPLLGAIEMGFGLLMALVGARPGGARSLMTLLGLVALGLGIVVLAEPSFLDDLHRYLGVHDRNAWLYVLTGAVAILVAMVSPTFFRRERPVGRRDVVESY